MNVMPREFYDCMDSQIQKPPIIEKQPQSQGRVVTFGLLSHLIINYYRTPGISFPFRRYLGSLLAVRQGKVFSEAFAV